MKNPFLLIAVFGLTLQSGLSQQFSPRYELVKMGPEVNTKNFNEVAPVISPDGKKLYFVTANTDNSQDIWTSNLDDKGVWVQAKKVGAPLNQNRFNQVFNVLADGSLFVRGGRSHNSKGFSLVSASGSWQELNIQDYEKMDKGVFSGGTISSDAKHIIIYFSEAAGVKRSDLYISNIQPNGEWSRPVKLPVSTSFDEFGPFISPDQTTLFFASDRTTAGRIGGVDTYKITRLDDTWTKWSEPVNLGKGVNTTGGDAYFSSDAQGNVFTCRMGSVVDGGNYDIFILKPRDIKIMLNVTVINEKTQQPVSANVDLKIKDQKTQSFKANASGKFDTRIPEIDAYVLSATAPQFLPREQTFKMPKINNDTTLRVVINLSQVAKRLYLAGKVYDKKTNQPLTAKVEITSRSDKNSNFSIQSTGGKYEQDITSFGLYALAASAEGYLNTSDSVSVGNEDESPGVKDLYLAPIEVGTTVRLKNIYFDFDKTTLKSESYVELNKVVEFLKVNSRIAVEIAGHTDSKGADTYNENLSQGRSQSVVDYIISQGIDSSRLTAHGYGESKPIDTNETEEGRSNNRRVEFTVLKN